MKLPEKIIFSHIKFKQQEYNAAEYNVNGILRAKDYIHLINVSLCQRCIYYQMNL